LVKICSHTRCFSVTPLLRSSFLHYSSIPLFQHSIIPLAPYLNFNVLIDSSARMMAMIQKRTVTLDSGHPLSSK